MSIEYIIKRNGTKEPFDPTKLNGWGIWASNNLGNFVDWAEAILHVYSVNNKDVTSEQLQNSLIVYCLTKNSWS